jgi:hypothetical protein
MYMAKSRDKHSLEDNPFADGLLQWMDSPEGQRYIEVSDVLRALMKDVQLDAKDRRFVWPGAKRLTFDQSVSRIRKQHRNFAVAVVRRFLISRIEHYAPDDFSEEQLQELDRLANEWADELRQARGPD